MSPMSWVSDSSCFYQPGLKPRGIKVIWCSPGVVAHFSPTCRLRVDAHCWSNWASASDRYYVCHSSQEHHHHLPAFFSMAVKWSIVTKTDWRREGGTPPIAAIAWALPLNGCPLSDGRRLKLHESHLIQELVRGCIYSGSLAYIIGHGIVTFYH